MKRKTLMTMAVAATFGLSAAAFAGSGHEVITPFSVKDAGENIVSHEKGFSDSYNQSSIGSSSSEASGWVSGAYDSSLLDSESTASLGTDDSYALANDGVYSDFYVVSFEPVALGGSWDVYAINADDTDQLASADQFELLPTYDLALITADESPGVELVPAPQMTGGEMLGD